ncbi:MAG: YdeI/OmpD-associated family protein [Phormidesmis sp. FL-bin-119]|nr:YdeI/OmpD-associated family protein [Pedobacter sp.]
MNEKVDFYFNKGKWQLEVQHLRMILQDTQEIGYQLDEHLKWGVPCYTFQNKNILLMHVFKEYCALLFFKGVLLKDPKGILIQQTENVQAARQIRFTTLEDIIKLEPELKAYVREAIELETAGLKVSFKKTTDFVIPDEFQEKLNAMKVLKIAFDALTPGRQRAYIFYFSQAKQSKTRSARVEKCIPQILVGKGLDD